MTTKVVTAMRSGAANDVAAELAKDVRAQLGGAAAKLVVAFASTKQPLAELAPRLMAELPGATILAASTAGEFTERGDAKGGVSIFALAGDYVVHAGMSTKLHDDPDGAVERALAKVPREVDGFPHRTAILLLDPLAGRSEEAALIASGLLGAGVPLAGGAAGDDLAMKQCVVACGGEAASDAVVLAVVFSKAPLGVGVCHGHTAFSDPIKVTRADGNVVHELDGRPAWDVWRERTRDVAAKAGLDVDHLAKEQEGGYLLSFEAGLEGSGAEIKIRAPLARSGPGGIGFACGIAEGSVIRITQSSSDKQIDSAREAARRARAALGEKKPAGAIVFDCICRNLILGDRFASAVRGISEELGGAPVAGFETYGEIALAAGDMSGFHNTTSVVLSFPV